MHLIYIVVYIVHCTFSKCLSTNTEHCIFIVFIFAFIINRSDELYIGIKKDAEKKVNRLKRISICFVATTNFIFFFIMMNFDDLQFFPSWWQVNGVLYAFQILSSYQLENAATLYRNDRGGGGREHDKKV